jgi:hypothetical protein
MRRQRSGASDMLRRCIERYRVVSIAAFVCFISNVAIAANSTSANSFQLSGSGTLAIDSAPQKHGEFVLRASLQSIDALIASQPPVQSGGGFAMMAAVTSAVQVCYNDTIFRDDFDGDGG